MAQYMTQQGYVTSSLQKAKTRARQEAEDYGRSYVENTESGKTVYRTNPRQPHKRVRKALKKYAASQGLPTQYTPAKVRVNPKGGLDIKFARPPKGATRDPRGFSVTALDKNGRSYAAKGSPPPRGWEPKTGNVVYIEGRKTKLGAKDSDGLFRLRPPINGTTAMSGGNLRQVARI